MHPQSPGQTLHETLHHSTQALADTDVFAYAQYLNIDLDRHPEVRTAALSPSLSPRPSSHLYTRKRSRPCPAETLSA